MAKDNKKASSGFFDNAPSSKLYEKTTEIDSKTGKPAIIQEAPEILEEISVSKSSSSSSAPPPIPGGNAQSPSEEQDSVEQQVDDALDFAERNGESAPPKYFKDENPNGLADEPTHILDLEEIQSMPEIKSAKLHVIDGPERGKEFLISYNEMFGGRSIENDFVISDLAISRRHFRITRSIDDYILTDLESGNGTYLNGVRIHQQVLNHDDVIVVGKSVIRFTSEADEASAEAQTSKKETGFPAPPPTSEATAPPPTLKKDAPSEVENKKTMEMGSLQSESAVRREDTPTPPYPPVQKKTLDMDAIRSDEIPVQKPKVEKAAPPASTSGPDFARAEKDFGNGEHRGRAETGGSTAAQGETRRQGGGSGKTDSQSRNKNATTTTQSTERT